MRKYTQCAVPQTQFNNVRKIVYLFFTVVPDFYAQITRNEMSLMNVCWMYFHPLSNVLIIGFKHPIFMIDVCRYKNSVCYLIQTLH